MHPIFPFPIFPFLSNSSPFLRFLRPIPPLFPDPFSTLKGYATPRPMTTPRMLCNKEQHLCVCFCLLELLVILVCFLLFLCVHCFGCFYFCFMYCFVLFLCHNKNQHNNIENQLILICQTNDIANPSVNSKVYYCMGKSFIPNYPSLPCVVMMNQNKLVKLGWPLIRITNQIIATTSHKPLRHFTASHTSQD